LSKWERTAAKWKWEESTVVEPCRVILCKDVVVVLFVRRPLFIFRSLLCNFGLTS
jgi:hypothetical protein